MIKRKEILNTLSDYDLKNLSIATICSHSALQIFHGAKKEGFRTVGICLADRKLFYESFPEASPDEFIIIKDYKDVLDGKVQKKLVRSNSIVITHGSFVEYVGAKKLLESFSVPTYGNRHVLEWEGDRAKQYEWFRKAGLKVPKIFKDPSEIDGLAFVKVHGARGGQGYFKVSSPKEFHEKLDEKTRKKWLKPEDKIMIQEFIAGVRYYPHYFYTEIHPRGLKLRTGGIELLSMDRRLEPIDEIYRGLPDIVPEFLDYTVTGNQPVVIRESLLPEIFRLGSKLVEASVDLFPPGLLGPFCLETIYSPDRGFVVFEVSARIVAGTNLYPEGSPYTPYLFKESMSTGRRIALNIKEALTEKKLEKLIY